MSKRFYRGKYFIVFYDESDEQLRYMFDNVIEILKFIGKPITTDNVKKIDIYLYRALRRRDRLCRFLTGEALRVYLIDIN